MIADAHANFGVYPGAGGAAVLPRRLVPLNVAMYLLLTGKSLSSTEMKAHGLVCEVHPDAGLSDAVQKLARHIARKSPVALRRMKEVARASADKTRRRLVARAGDAASAHAHLRLPRLTASLLRNAHRSSRVAETQVTGTINERHLCSWHRHDRVRRLLEKSVYDMVEEAVGYGSTMPAARRRRSVAGLTTAP